MKRSQDNHAYGADDTAIIAAVPYGSAEHSPMAGHGLLAPPDPAGEEGRDDGLATELAKSAPRIWWNRGTLVLGGIALILAGLLGGIQVQKHYGTATTAAGAGAARGAFGGAGRGAGGFPGAGGASGAATAPAAASGTTGTVKLVDGDTIYVQTADGTVVTVKTSGNTSVKTATKGTLKDVKAGASVTVQGATGSDGSVTATSVTTDKK